LRTEGASLPENALYRYEVKLPLEHEQFADLQHNLYEQGLFLRQAYPARVVHSIYLDTPDLADYLANVSGQSSRKKLRLRWYDEASHKLVLEIKFKTNKSSKKLTLPLAASDTQLPRTAECLKAFFDANGAQDLYPFLHEVVPVLEVSYRRSYYELAREIRMTVDRQIHYRRLYPVAQSRAVASPVDTVVELKFSTLQTGHVKTFLSGIPFRAFRHSKYVVGMDTVCVF
jgi:hypothetical protein